MHVRNETKLSFENFKEETQELKYEQQLMIQVQGVF